MPCMIPLLEAKDISSAIQELLQTYPESAQEINNGLCGEFARQLEENNFGEAIWGDGLCIMLWSSKAILTKDWFTHFAYGHCFIRYYNKYYDSECPKGVDLPDQLPFYQRQLAKQE